MPDLQPGEVSNLKRQLDFDEIVGEQLAFHVGQDEDIDVNALIDEVRIYINHQVHQILPDSDGLPAPGQ